MAPISNNLREFITVFKFLSTIKDPALLLRNVKHLSSDDKFNSAIREIAYNIVRKNIPLTKKDKKLLLPFEKTIANLANAKTPLDRLKIIQKGKGAIVGSLLTSLALGLINELVN